MLQWSTITWCLDTSKSGYCFKRNRWAGGLRGSDVNTSTQCAPQVDECGTVQDPMRSKVKMRTSALELTSLRQTMAMQGRRLRIKSWCVLRVASVGLQGGEDEGNCRSQSDRTILKGSDVPAQLAARRRMAHNSCDS